MTTYITYHDSPTDVERILFRLRQVKKNNCLYFIDSSMSKGHLSFHQDMSVWLTPNDTSKKKQRIVDPYERQLTDGLYPFLIYKPQQFNSYEIINNESKGVKYVLNGMSDEIDQYVIVCCLIRADPKKAISTNIKKMLEDRGLYKLGGDIKFDGTKDDGTKISGTLSYTPIYFGKHIIHVQIEKCDKKILPGIGYMAITSPHQKMSVYHFIENTEFPQLKSNDLSDPPQVLMKQHDKRTIFLFRT